MTDTERDDDVKCVYYAYTEVNNERPKEKKCKVTVEIQTFIDKKFQHQLNVEFVPRKLAKNCSNYQSIWLFI